MNTNWRFYKLKIMSVNEALLKDLAVGCKDAVSHKPLLKNTYSSISHLKESTKAI